MKTKKFLLSIGALIIILLGICTIVYFTHDCEKHIEWLDEMMIDSETGETHSAGYCRICDKYLSFIDGELQDE